MDFLTGLSQTLLCNFLLSLGFVMQKKGIAWLGRKSGSYPSFKNDRLLWILGFMLVNISPLFNFLAFGYLGPQIVIAVSGLNIVFTIFLSRLILKNSLLPSDYVFSFLITLCIIGVGLISKQDSNTGHVALFWPLVFFSIPLFLFILYFILRPLLKEKFTPIIQTVLLAFVAGSMAGYMTILMKLVRMTAQGIDLLAYLKTPYLYFYLLFGILSFVAISLAYRRGSIIVISPIQYGMIVLFPVIATYPIFNQPIQIVQIILFVTIATCVGMIVSKHAPVDAPTKSPAQ